MATPVRVTGIVTAAPAPRTGTSAKGNPYSIREVSVLVGGRGVAEVSGSTDEFPAVYPGQVVDLLVEADIYANRLQLRFAGIFDENANAALLAAADA